MKLCIELPTWLGDCVMATPAIESIVEVYPEVELTLFGSPLTTAIFSEHPHVKHMVIDKSRDTRLRWLNLCKTAKKLGTFDIALSFRSSMSSRFFLWCIQANKKAFYTKDKHIQCHQVLRYNDFVENVFGFSVLAHSLQIHISPTSYAKPTLGINPGASYGSAKRWYPEKFAQVAITLSENYNIIIFGGPSEVDMANDIEVLLKNAKVTNYQNIAGKTNIVTLCEKIGGLSLFITGDSGPMHIATAYNVPTVALFGPTKDKETSPWQNPKSIIVKKEMDCAPCMKRTCPLKHHECMKLIEVDDVLHAVLKITKLL